MLAPLVYAEVAVSVPQHSAVLLTASVSQEEGAELALAQAPSVSQVEGVGLALALAPSVTTFQVEAAEPEQAQQVPP